MSSSSGDAGTDRLADALAEHASLEAELADPAVHADADRARRLGRRYASLAPLVESARALEETRGDLAAARELAAAIARNGPLALDASKRIIRASLDWTQAEAWARQGEIAGPVLGSRDAQEGATAFAQKRDPVWRGR